MIRVKICHKLSFSETYKMNRHLHLKIFLVTLQFYASFESKNRLYKMYHVSVKKFLAFIEFLSKLIELEIGQHKNCHF